MFHVLGHFILLIPHVRRIFVKASLYSFGSKCILGLFSYLRSQHETVD
jgi:hypothetical protein